MSYHDLEWNLDLALHFSLSLEYDIIFVSLFLIFFERNPSSCIFGMIESLEEKKSNDN